MNEPTIKKAMTTLEFLSQDSEARIRYEERQKGKQQGERQKALEIAKNLLKEGLAIDLISKVTGISEKEIMSLKPLK